MILALILYFGALTGLVFWSSRQVKSSSDFIIGNRSMNFWLTAMAAHASDMSSWLFMGYPALIFAGGLFKSWVAVGLVVCMWFNWQWIATKFRTLTGEWNCSTFSGFLSRRFQDEAGWLPGISALFCFLFYTVYICAFLTGLGLLGHSLLGISYEMSILAGAAIVVTYVILGGFVSLAWIDLVQGIFLMIVITAVPLVVINNTGGWDNIVTDWQTLGTDLRIVPTTGAELFSVITMLFGWGLGYFGQPHIVTKFMGIRNPQEISKSRNVGMAWMILSLAAATLVGMVGISYFQGNLADPQMVFINMAQATFSPFLMGLILCAVLAATINVMSSQLLILSSILTEDIYKRFFKKELSSRHLLNVSRFWIVVAALFSYAIASAQLSSIYTLVHYAWSGLGASFGPLILVALYSTRVNKYGALAGMLAGGITAAVWPFAGSYLPVALDPLIPGFIFSFAAIFGVSYLTRTHLATA